VDRSTNVREHDDDDYKPVWPKWLWASMQDDDDDDDNKPVWPMSRL
jgi:hypothetical protein